jgi:hypothetical protein
MAGQIKVDSINADSNLALKIANTAVAFIDSSGLRPTSGNVNLDATATSKLYLPSANTVAIQTAGVTAVTVDSSQNVGIGTASPAYKLDASGIIRANGGYFRSTNTYTVFTGADILGTTGGMTSIGANPLVFGTDGTEQARIDSAGLFKFNSGYGSAATAYGCRAWVNFNGTGTVAIRGSGNVSSITDNGTGDYTVNFTTAMPDANYSAIGSSNYGGATITGMSNITVRSLLTTSCGVSNQFTNGSVEDVVLVCVSIFR